MPLTLQKTPASVVPVTTAPNVARPFTPTVALGGATVTVTLLKMVTPAETVCVPAVAWSVSGFGVGRSSGAVNAAELALVLTIVPTVAFPPTTPFTSQTIGVFAGAHNAAVKSCICPSATFAEGGDIEFGVAQTSVTVAEADLEGSATLVTVTIAPGGDGIVAGAAYEAESTLVLPIVPTDEFPPAIPFTLQATTSDGLPALATLARKDSVEPSTTVAEDGAMPIEMPLTSATLAEAFAFVSASDVAVTVTVCAEGKICGAVYWPVAEIIPNCALPPAIPSTLHVTEGFVVPLALAVNTVASPNRTETFVGEIVTTICGGGGLDPPPPVRPAQPTRSDARTASRSGAAT